MTFSKDETGKKNLFTEIFDPELFMCYLEEDGLPPLRYAHDDTTHTLKAEK